MITPIIEVAVSALLIIFGIFSISQAFIVDELHPLGLITLLVWGTACVVGAYLILT